MPLRRSPADKAFSEAIRESYDYTCANCERSFRQDPGYLHCAHVHTRKHRSTRWLAPTESGATGAIALCAKCHRRFTDYPIEHAEFCRRHLGDTGYEEAKRLAWESRKFTKAEQAEVAAHYRAEVRRIEALRANGETGYIRLVGYE